MGHDNYRHAGGGKLLHHIQDDFAAVLGAPLESTEEGWPNAPNGKVVERPRLEAGTFRSPHGIAINKMGVIAVSEWMIGGRLVLLSPA
ncbi:hypothetical protein H4V95_002158 [Arthrobacter sp. CAN_C5]|nr:hypothetical protein [Arthrobacter sp. CAN_C5]